MEQEKHDTCSGNNTIIPLDDSAPNLAPYGFCSSCHGIHNPHNNLITAGLVFLSETCIPEIFWILSMSHPSLEILEVQGNLECRESITDSNRLNRPLRHCYFTAPMLAYRHSAFIYPFPEFQRIDGPKVPYSFRSQTWQLTSRQVTPPPCLGFGPNRGWGIRGQSLHYHLNSMFCFTNPLQTSDPRGVLSLPCFQNNSSNLTSALFVTQ